jgi:ABC-type antimicrobial peptide transport system permease subunit
MKFISLVVTLVTFVLTTGLLYLLGHIFTIPWLMFHYEFKNKVYGLSITAGSFVPIILGLLCSYFAERIYIYKYRQKLRK